MTLGVIGMLLEGMRRSDRAEFIMAFPIFVLMIPIAIYITIGRFFYKASKKRRTVYAVTNRRVLSLCCGHREVMRAAFIGQIPTINASIGRDGRGTISFGNRNWMSEYWANTGMDWFGGFYGDSGAVAFYGVHNAQKVNRIVQELMSA